MDSKGAFYNAFIISYKNVCYWIKKERIVKYKSSSVVLE